MIWRNVKNMKNLLSTIEIQSSAEKYEVEQLWW